MKESQHWVVVMDGNPPEEYYFDSLEGATLFSPGSPRPGETLKEWSDRARAAGWTQYKEALP